MDCTETIVMDIEQLRDHVLSIPEVEECQPFGDETLVYKTLGKMFLLISLDSEVLQFNVKCDPDKAIELRDEYSCVLPGYHMNKKHWNTIIVDGTLTGKQLKEMIFDSYTLVRPKRRK